MASIPSSIAAATVDRSASQSTAPAGKPKLLKLKEVCHRVGFGESKVRGLVRAGTFPKPVKVGGYAARWVSEEVDAWIDDQIAARDQTR